MATAAMVKAGGLMSLHHGAAKTSVRSSAFLGSAAPLRFRESAVPTLVASRSSSMVVRAGTTSEGKVRR
jgi:hypothetical protein